jgi:pilus assembly protein Flp/PilA
MATIKMITRHFIKNEEAATMVEYGLMVALIAVVAIAAVTALGTNVSDKFQQVADAIGGAG